MVHIATLVAVNLIVPSAQPLETVQYRDRAEIAHRPIDTAAEAHAAPAPGYRPHYFDDREFWPPSIASRSS